MTAVKRIVTITTCDRCSFGGEKRADTERVFALEDRYYRLDLCEAHAEMFDRDLGGWTRLAAEVDAPHRQHHAHFDDAARQDAQRLKELAEKAQHKAQAELFDKRRAEARAKADAKREQAARQTIAGAAKWTLTGHARQRMTERGFTVEQVLQTAAFPKSIRQQPWHPEGLVVHVYDDCRLVINPFRAAVITVLPRDHPLESGPQAARNGKELHDDHRTTHPRSQ